MNRLTDPLLPEPLALARPERNQRWLSQRLAFWRARIEQRASEVEGMSAATPSDDPDDAGSAASVLATLFGLSTFERELLLLAAGVDIDASLRGAVARAQGIAPGQSVRLAFSLALAVLPHPHWDALSPSGPLRHWLLIDVDTSFALDQAALRVDERVLHHLTGVAAVDEALLGVARFETAVADPALATVAARIAHAVDRSDTVPPLVLLPDAQLDAARRSAARTVACMACEALGLRTLSVDVAAFASTCGADPRALVATARRIDREAALTGAAVLLALDTDATPTGNTLLPRLIEALRSPALVLGALTPAQLAEAGPRRLLRFALPPLRPMLPAQLPAVLRRVAARALEQFHVEPALMLQALESAAGIDDEVRADALLWDTLRESARGGLDALAQRITSRATFDDLVVPPLVAAQLGEIASQLKHRRTVHDDWGFGAQQGRGLGIAALFAGESGTGKTLAAEAIANEARLDLYRIDLASVVSKYIGETEKNLSRLFDAAERSGAVLLFDEADALFGKRSEVKDSHDRYANIEVAYLLQRIETYRGLAILTTNLKSALDRAFLRRIRFVVQFPFPDASARAEIWHRSFPAGAPLGALDWAALARLPVPGGNIRGIAVNAAFRAAEHGGAIEQADLLASARAEFSKLERAFNGADGAARARSA